MKKPKVLIVGAGIAGPALAYWLSRNGYRPTVVELAGDLGLYGATVPLEPDTFEDPSEMTMLTVPNRMLVLHSSRTTPLAIFTFRAARPTPHDRKNLALHKQMVADAVRVPRGPAVGRTNRTAPREAANR